MKQPAVAETHRVEDVHDGQRLDNYIFRERKHLPKPLVYRLIRTGQVRINSCRAKPHSRLAAGDLLRFPPAAEANAPPPTRQPLPVSLTTLLEDEHLLAVDKPSGLAVHGGSGVAHGVIERLRARPDAAKFLELIHRLDKDTSGVLLLAKKPAALRELQSQWRKRMVRKKYILAVFGCWRESAARIDAPLVRERNGIGSRVAKQSDTNAKEAITKTKVLRQWSQAALLEADIITGRTHQLRVHLAQAGLPIIGDKKYGDFPCNQQLATAGHKRLFLHAQEIQFIHPLSQEKKLIIAPLPAVFEDLGRFFGEKS